MPLGAAKAGLMGAAGSAAGTTGNFAGGIGGVTNVIDQVNISSTGDATDHGDLNTVKAYSGATDNGTSGRAVIGSEISSVNEIDYWTVGTPGNASDFGELSKGRWYTAALSNATNNRGIFGGGDIGAPTYYSNIIDYITITSTGNATNFGDMASVTKTQSSGLDNGTNDRGVFMGGYTPPTESDQISYITITSLGDAATFGDLQSETYSMTSVSNAVNERGVSMGGKEGEPSAVTTNRIDFITINSTGNAADHGNLTIATTNNGRHGADNGVDDRGLIGGGHDGAATNAIQYVTITGTAGATDFGDLTADGGEGVAGVSNGAT